MPSYFVNNVTGNDQNAGDQAHPFATIAKAVARAAPGDTIKVVPTDKPYADRFTAAASGTATSRITITSSTTDKPRITPSSSWVFTGDYWTVELMDFNGFQARPIQIGGSPLSGLGPDDDFANYITVQDCLFRHAIQEAVWICHTTNALVQRCTFRDVRRREAGKDICAIMVFGGGGIAILDCLFEDIGSDGVHIGARFHQINDVTVQNCTFRVNRPYGSQPWQNFSTNVGENGIDIKSNWDSLTGAKLVGPVLIVGCEIYGFRTSVQGQDCSDGVSGGQTQPGIVIHCDATAVTIKDTKVHDCDEGVTAGKGSLGTTAGFAMTGCTLRDLDIGIKCNEAKAGVTVENTTIVAREALHVHTSPLTIKSNVVDAVAYTRAAQTGVAEVFASNRWVNRLPPAEWRSPTDTTGPGTPPPPPTNDLTAIAAELDASANNLRQQAAFFATKAAAIRAIAEKL